MNRVERVALKYYVRLVSSCCRSRLLRHMQIQAIRRSLKRNAQAFWGA